MNELLDYLLKLDEPADRSQVEARLREDPAARRDLQALRRLIAPLAADQDGPEPPPGLVARTIGRVAEYACAHRRPPAPTTPSAAPAAPRVEDRLQRLSPDEWTQVIASLDRATAAPSRWRWADLAVVAAILFVGVGLILATLPSLRQRQGVVLCQNQLRELHAALDTYADAHGEKFPTVSEEPPNNIAAAFLPMLREAGTLPTEGKIGCPAASGGPVVFAYSLGYRDENGILHGLRRDLDLDLLPIAADRPAIARTTPNPDHRTGQNVLFVGGHVMYCTSGNVGIAGDDIYRNQDLLVRAGVKLVDTVLGVAGDRP